MSKQIPIDKDAIVRVQKVGGGTMELRGVFACQVATELADNFVVNLDQPGHHTVGVFGGILQQTDQTSLPLNDPDRDKRAKKVGQQIVANLAPASDDIKAIKTALVKQLVEDVTYDDDTGLYCITIGPGEKKKGKRFNLTFTNGTVAPVEPKKKLVKVKTAAGESFPEKEYAMMLDLDRCRQRPHDYNHAIILLCLNVIELDVGKDDFGRNIDRWRWLAANGADDKELLTHIRESFGGSKGRDQVIGGFTHRVVGKKSSTGITFCINRDDSNLPAWVKPGDRENFQSPKNDLVAGIRSLMKIPELKTTE